MLCRWFGRLTVLTYGEGVPKMWLAAAKRGRRSVPPVLEGQEATADEVSELQSDQKREERQRRMQRVQPRALREPDEQIEREIGKLMDQGKSDKEIIELLSRQQSERPTPKSKAQARQEKNLEKQMNSELDAFGAMTQEEESVYRQKAFIDMMKEEVPQRNRKPINKRIQRSDDAHEAMTKEFIKRDRVLDILEKRKNPEEYVPPSSADVNNIAAPEEARSRMERYKNREMKFFAELLRDDPEDGGHMLNRRYPKKPKETAIEFDRDFALKKEPYPVDIQPYESKKQRLLKQFEEVNKPSIDDKQFGQAGATDLGLTNRESGIVLNEFEKKYDRQSARESGPHNKQLAKVKKQHQQLQQQNIYTDLEDLVQLSKQSLMEQKKYLEGQEIFNERLQRKEKIEKMKKLQNKINAEKLSDRVDYKAPEQLEGFKLSKHKDVFGQPDIEKLDQLNEKYARSVFNGTREEIDYLYHRTIKNMEGWLGYQLTAVNTVTRVFHQIHIVEIEPNDKLTVLKVVWKLRPALKPDERDAARYFDEKRQQKESEQTAKKVQFIQKNLDKTAQLMSVRMCQELKLRQGPDIRFFYYKESQEIQSTQDRLMYQMPEIIKQKIKQSVEKGTLPKTMKPEDLERMVGDLEDEFRTKISKIEDPEHPLTKTKEKPSHKQKHQANRTADGRRKKTERKKPAAQRFWQRL